MNQLASNPFTLDTVNVTPAIDTDVDIRQFEFIDYNADIDSVQLKDRLGNIVWETNGEADLTNVRSGHIGWVKGLALTILTAGVVRVYIK